MDILEKLNWRYATKQFDAQKKLTDDQYQHLAKVRKSLDEMVTKI